MLKSLKSLFSNIFFSTKKISKLCKTYIPLLMFFILITSISGYAYSYLLYKVIGLLENDISSFDVLLSTMLPVLILVVIVIYIERLRYDVLDYYNMKITYILKLEFSLLNLRLDYEKVELKEAQEELQKARIATNQYNGILGIVYFSFYVISGLVKLIIGLSIISTVNIYLVIIIFVLGTFNLFIKSKNQKINKQIRDEQIPWNRKYSYVDNISSNLGIGKDLRIYNMNGFIDEEFNNARDNLLRIYKKRNKKDILFNFFTRLIVLLSNISLYGFLVYEVLEKGMKISTFSFMLSNVSIVIVSLSAIAENLGITYSKSLEVTDYRECLNGKYDLEGCTEVPTKDTFELEFRNVYYQYINQEGYALENISFKIKKGEKVSLVGYNGAGKTTIVKLICGLYHPTKGNIYINGVDINIIDRSYLADVISPVFQDYDVYVYPIYTNISMKYENDDSEKVKKLIDLVELNKKIDSLKDKEYSILGRDLEENGIDFSGGEKQKLLIARSAYKDAFLYILDEPTSAMDALAEVNLYKNYNEIVKGNSSIFISHRLASTRICDRILVLDNGKLIQEGKHDTLIKEEGLYKDLFTKQAEYYKKEDSDNE